MKVQIGQQASEGIIIVDIILLTQPPSSQEVNLPVRVDIMDFEFNNANAVIIEIGSTNLTPTVKTNVKTLEFDAATKTLKVLNSSGTSVLTVSTNNTTVLARVNFATGTITIYQ